MPSPQGGGTCSLVPSAAVGSMFLLEWDSSIKYSTLPSSTRPPAGRLLLFRLLLSPLVAGHFLAAAHGEIPRLLAWAWVMASPRPTVQRLFFRQAGSKLTPFLRGAARAATRVVPPLSPPSFKLAHGWGCLACGLSSWLLSRKFSQQFGRIRLCRRPLAHRPVVFYPVVFYSRLWPLAFSPQPMAGFPRWLPAWAWVMASPRPTVQRLFFQQADAFPTSPARAAKHPRRTCRRGHHLFLGPRYVRTCFACIHTFTSRLWPRLCMHVLCMYTYSYGTRAMHVYLLTRLGSGLAYVACALHAYLL